jgi:haloalkane dehalogenase
VREFTKSALSFSWAMSMFGAQQVAGLFAPSKSAKDFDGVTGAAREEFGEALRALFGEGDRVQRGIVDLAFGLFPPRLPTFNSNEAASGVPPKPAEVGSPSAGNGQDKPRVTETPPLTSPHQNPSQPQTGAGWGAMPVASSASFTQGQPSKANAEGDGQHISADYPFAPRYVEVFGSRMHYVDEGEGDPILLVHGNATWSYIWRNVIPHLTPHARCVAPDLIGFGLSDKPDIKYQWIEQAKYLEEFIRKVGLKNVTLVLNDFGISLGQLYAMHHEDNVKGIAFFEGVFKTFKSLEEAYSPDFRPLFKQFRTGGEGGEGYKLLVDQNFFIEQLLPRAAGRELTEEELRRYREPFKEVRSRVPIWRFARSVPIGGEPRDVWWIMTETTDWFKRTTLPKLLFYATPGGLVTAEFVEWCRRNLQNLKVVYVGTGIHYLTESTPHVIGRELVEWLGELGSAGALTSELPGLRGRSEVDEQSV